MYSAPHDYLSFWFYHKPQILNRVSEQFWWKFLWCCLAGSDQIKQLDSATTLIFSDFCSETKWTWLMLLWANWPSEHYARYLERYFPFFSRISLDIISFTFIAISFDFCFYFHCNIFWFLLLKKKSKIKKTQSTKCHYTWYMKSFHQTYFYNIYFSNTNLPLCPKIQSMDCMNKV